MNLFRQHEQFEIQVLERLQSSRFLEQLIFGGGTMLRLCHELPRYSADIDFYLKSGSNFIEDMCIILASIYQITDQQDKFNTYLIEIKSTAFPRKLKIEINKETKIRRPRPAIAFSPFSPLQVPVNVVPLLTMIKFKVAALLDRREIRDAYDLEFLLRRGIPIAETPDRIQALIKTITAFRPADYKVKLGSILPEPERRISLENKFSFLLGHLNMKLNTGFVI